MGAALLLLSAQPVAAEPDESAGVLSFIVDFQFTLMGLCSAATLVSTLMILRRVSPQRAGPRQPQRVNQAIQTDPWEPEVPLRMPPQVAVPPSGHCFHRRECFTLRGSHGVRMLRACQHCRPVG